MLRRFFITAAFLAAVVFCAQIQPEELIALGIREINAISQYSGKEIELSFPQALKPVEIGTENYTIKAELSAKVLGPTVYIKYTVYDLEQNFLKGFRIKASVSIWAEAFYAKHMIYRGEDVTLEDFYPARTDILKYSKYLAEPTVFRTDQILTTDLQPDSPLFAWMLSVKKLVNVGDRVALYVINEGVTLKIEGKALQAGVLGGKILVQVQNEKHRVFKAEIIAPGECQIIL